MFNIKILFTTILTIQAYGLEDNGISNYLLKALKDKEYYISYSNKKPLPFKEGESFEGKIEAECELGMNIDEELSDKLNRWISYETYICNTISLEIIK